MIRSLKYNEQLFDKNEKYHGFAVRVMVCIENRNNINSKKLGKLKIRPFQTLEKVADSVYKIHTG